MATLDISESVAALGYTPQDDSEPHWQAAAAGEGGAPPAPVDELTPLPRFTPKPKLSSRKTGFWQTLAGSTNTASTPHATNMGPEREWHGYEKDME